MVWQLLAFNLEEAPITQIFAVLVTGVSLASSSLREVMVVAKAIHLEQVQSHDLNRVIQCFLETFVFRSKN